MSQSSKRGVQYSQVADVAEALALRGERVTAGKVRKVLGCGSSATIHQYLLQWKASRASPSQGASVSRENAVRDYMCEIMKRVNAAQACLKKELDTLRKQCSELRVDLPQEEEALSAANVLIAILEMAKAQHLAPLEQRLAEGQAASDACQALVRAYIIGEAAVTLLPGLEAERNRLRESLEKECGQ